MKLFRLAELFSGSLDDLGVRGDTRSWRALLWLSGKPPFEDAPTACRQADVTNDGDESKRTEPLRLAAFYEALGLKFQKERHGRGPEHVSAQLGGGVLEIYPLRSGQQDTTGVRLGFSVKDLEIACRSAQAAWGEVVTSPKTTEWGRQATLRDPAGHLVDLVQA